MQEEFKIYLKFKCLLQYVDPDGLYPDPDPDPQNLINSDPGRIQVHKISKFSKPLLIFKSQKKLLIFKSL